MTGSRFSVIIADDDVAISSAHRSIVDALPAARVVDVTHTARQTLDSVERLRPDLLLLDIYLPDASGLEVLTRARELHPDVDVIVISAAHESETVRAALRGGVVGYLFKPFRVSDLQAKLGDYARRRSMLTENRVLRQREVDLMTGALPVAAATPKGLSPHTARRVEDALRAAPSSLSSSDVASELGMSRVAARSYLEWFVASGLASVEPEYGGSGRPTSKYRWAATLRRPPE